MDLKIETYWTTPRRVQAVVVTADNIEAVSEWCGGQIEGGTKPAISIISTPKGGTLSGRKTVAYVGDIVSINQDGGVEAYRMPAFVVLHDGGPNKA